MSCSQVLKGFEGNQPCADLLDFKGSNQVYDSQNDDN